jgi:hypothetical protein
MWLRRKYFVANENGGAVATRSPDARIVIAGATIVFVSELALTLLIGASSDDELLGRNVYEFVAPSSLEAAGIRHDQARAGVWPRPELTHGSVRQRPEWKARQTELPVPFDTYHRNDQPDTVRAAADGRAPVVVAETMGGYVLLLVPEDLDACGGSIESMVDAIERAAQRHGLVWTAA